MFGRHYFGGRHFGPRYFGDGGVGAPTPARVIPAARVHVQTPAPGRRHNLSTARRRNC